MVALKASFLFVLYLVLHYEGRTLATPSQATEWAARLALEDPGWAYPGQDMAAGVPKSLVEKRQRIFQLIELKQTQTAIDEATRAISAVKLSILRFPMNIFLQTLYMAKIKAQAVDGQYFGALLTSVEFLAFCDASQWDCPQKDMLKRQALQIENGMKAMRTPAELLGLNEEELNNEAKFMAAYRRILQPLEPRRNIWMNRDLQSYVAALHKWAKEPLDNLFKGLKDATAKYQQQSNDLREREERIRRQQQEGHRVASNQYQNGTPEGRKTAAQHWRGLSRLRPDQLRQTQFPQWGQTGSNSSSPVGPTPKPVAPEVNLDQSMIDERKAIESSRDIEEIVRLSQALINRIEANENLDRQLIAFLHEIYQYKIRSEVQSRKYMLALRDTAQFASMCEKQGWKCSQLNSIMSVRNELEQRFKDDEFGILGLNQADMINKAKLRKAKLKASIVLHPDKNMNLSEVHRKYVSDLFSRADTAFGTLMDRLGS